jgi:hypothetical protein
MGVYGECAVCIDGQQTIDTCKEIINLAAKDFETVTDVPGSITPIEICLLDF